MSKTRILFSLLFIGFVAKGATFELKTPHYQIKDGFIEISEGSCGDEFGSILIPGNPFLPCKLVRIAIPPGSEIINYDIKRELQLIPGDYSIIPVPPELNEIASLSLAMTNESNYSIRKTIKNYTETYDSTYSLNRLYPATAGTYLGMHKLYGYNITKFLILPFAYNPVTSKLYYSPFVTIKLNYTHQIHFPVLDTTFDAILKSNIINFSQIREWYKAVGRIRDTEYRERMYVIITHPTLASTIKDFVLWKKSLGYSVKITTHSQVNDVINWDPKYVLIIGDAVGAIHELPLQAIIGRIPYTEPKLVASILEHTIEFEINKIRNNILFVKGVSNYGNEDYSGVAMEDKCILLDELKSVVQMNPDWYYNESIDKEITGKYSIVNFLSPGKQWLYDDGDRVPEFNELIASNYIIRNDVSYLVFSPFAGFDFLKQGAVCVVSPDSSSQYIVGWQTPSFGGNQSFNYAFLKYLLLNPTVGDAFLQAKLWYETCFPQDTQNINAFKIWGDPSIKLKWTPQTDVGITHTPLMWLPPDTSFFPSCYTHNFGSNIALNCKLYCEIDSSKIPIYSHYIAIDTIKPSQDIFVKFPECRVNGIGISYRVRFELFLPQDENPINDTLSTVANIAAGDFLVFAPDTVSILNNTLYELGYKGVWSSEITSLYPWLKNFNSIFVSIKLSQEETDSIINFVRAGGNLYVEGNNVWLNKLLEGKVTDEEWFVPKGYVSTHTDSNNNVTGFYYEDKYKIWCLKFELSTLENPSLISQLVDSVMHFFGIKSRKGEATAAEIANLLLLQSLPNPFRTQTIIKFKIQKTHCPINLSVYNLTGNLVKNLLTGYFSPGEYEVLWDTCDESSVPVVNGIYFLRLQSDTESHLGKLIVLRYLR
ncbi:MAG: hypothetical protein QMD71_09320 [bacterium]|nr:hypothetical protein [bacterium]